MDFHKTWIKDRSPTKIDPSKFGVEKGLFSDFI